MVSSSDQLDELRSKNASEDASIDPKEKLHLVKYVKIDGKIMKLWECGICKDFFFKQICKFRFSIYTIYHI